MVTRLHSVLLVAMLLTLDVHGQNAIAKLNIYVAEFAADPKERPDLVRDVERTVESILVNSDNYTVLERPEATRLRLELRNEADITQNPEVRSSLAKIQADAVMLGRMHHDVESGQYVFYLKLVRVNGKIEWAREGPLQQGSINDYQSRKIALLEIINSTSPKPVSTMSPNRNGFLGTWSGTFYCESINPILRAGKTDWQVTRAGQSNTSAKVHENFYRAGVSGPIEYTAEINGNSMVATSQTGGRYQIDATLSSDGNTINGDYKGHPRCKTVSLQRLGQ